MSNIKHRSSRTQCPVVISNDSEKSFSLCIADYAGRYCKSYKISPRSSFEMTLGLFRAFVGDNTNKGGKKTRAEKTRTLFCLFFQKPDQVFLQ